MSKANKVSNFFKDGNQVLMNGLEQLLHPCLPIKQYVFQSKTITSK